MANYVENNLGKDEQIIQKVSFNYIVILPHIFLCFVGIGLITIWVPILSILTNELAVTNKKVIGKTGILSSHAINAPLNKVNNIAVSKSLFGKIFDYGTVRIETSSEAVGFAYIKNPERFKSLVLTQMDIFEEERIQKQAEAIAAATKQ